MSMSWIKQSMEWKHRFFSKEKVAGVVVRKEAHAVSLLQNEKKTINIDFLDKDPTVNNACQILQ